MLINATGRIEIRHEQPPQLANGPLSLAGKESRGQKRIRNDRLTKDLGQCSTLSA